MEILLLPLSHYTHVRSRIQQHTLRHYVLCGLAASFLMNEEKRNQIGLIVRFRCEFVVLICIFHKKIDLPPVVRSCPLFLPFHINHVRLRWDLVKWRSLFTYFIKFDLPPVVRNCPLFLPFHITNVRLRWDLVKYWS